jgi:cell division protein FtsI/penicillin-binding protein 2
MPFAAYGQGPVLVTPFKMARVVATIAANGSMPEGRWVIDGSNARTAPPKQIVAPDLAGFLASAMRSVVVEGTARRAMKGEAVSVAGKTGTAQLDEGMPHSWFAGFAPYEGDRAKSIAFAVVVEHGGYGGNDGRADCARSGRCRGRVGAGEMKISELIERLGRTVFETPFGGDRAVDGRIARGG